MNYADLIQGLFKVFFYLLVKITGASPYDMLVSMGFALIVLAGSAALNIAWSLPHALVDLQMRLKAILTS